MAAYVQYGCGRSAPREWVNFDASLSLRLERTPLLSRLRPRAQRIFPGNVLYGDIVKGLPLLPASCRAVYCSHVLEHLALDDFRLALRNSRRILAAGGIFRLVVPDLKAAARRYVADESGHAAFNFLHETSLGVTARPRNLRSFVRSWLGNSQHLWMWDFASLRDELQAAGFTGIRAARLGDCEDSRFRSVEEQARWEDAVGLQCHA
jgi:SAM-dependent methyltransferase